MTNPIYSLKHENIPNSGPDCNKANHTGRQTENSPENSGSVAEKLAHHQGHAGYGAAATDEPLYSSRIMGTYVEYLESFYPDIDINAILQYAGTTRHEVEDPGHWFTQHQTDRFHEIMVAQTGSPNLAREAGRFTVTGKNVGTAKRYIMSLMNPATVYLMIGKLVRMLSRGSVMTSRKLGPNRVEIVSKPTAGTREQPYQCQNRIGSFEAIAKMFTNKFAEVEHPSCYHKGGDCCRYIVTWEKMPFIIWKRISNLALFAGLMISLISFFALSGHWWVAPALACAGLNLILVLHSERLSKKDLIRTIEIQGDATKDLLDEVNIRHSNALMIQEIGQAVSKVLEVDRIAKTVVGIMQKHMHFDRGLVMLTNQSKSRLEFIAGFGYTDEQEKILLATEFNLQKDASSGHFVRSFKEQIPFLVKNVAEIENDLSPKSVAFIRRMDVRSFICVPIVYENESFGVLSVENTRSTNRLAQSEISLLMGVASQTAISINNALSFQKTIESERRYRLLADNISDVIWTIDPKTAKFTYASPSVERMQGFTPAELMALDLSDIFTPESYKLGAEIIAEELARQTREGIEPYRSRTLELEQYRKDGSSMWVEVTANFLRNPAGDLVGILGASRDISERKQAETEKQNLESRLQQAHKMEAIGTLAGGIAHDFNNILSAVLGFTEMALQDSSGNELVQSSLREVLTAGNRAKDLVKQILTFSRQAEQELKPVQVGLIIKEALKLLRASLPSTIEIKQNIKSHSATLADPTQIHQVLMNLCTNAHHAMQATGGILTVSLEDVSIDSEYEARKLELLPGDFLRLKVSDNGKGMPAAVKARIFEPFFTTKERDKGTGMGLAVVHGIVKGHGGAIAVNSQPEKRTTFDIYLPIIQISETFAVTASADLPAGNERILFVDDEKALVDLARKMMERLGYAVTGRTSSIEALELFKAKSEKFDLVITDMTMPNLTGDKLAREIISIRPDIPIILCTGFSEKINEDKARAMGLREFMLKPLVMAELSKAIRNALDA